MSTPPPAPSSVLTTRSEARERIYQTLLDDQAAHWSVSGLAERLPGVSAEAVRTTLYLLQRDQLVQELRGQRQLTFRLTDDGARALRTILNRWRAPAATPPPRYPERPRP